MNYNQVSPHLSIPFLFFFNKNWAALEILVPVRTSRVASTLSTCPLISKISPEPWWKAATWRSFCWALYKAIPKIGLVMGNQWKSWEIPKKIENPKEKMDIWGYPMKIPHFRKPPWNGWPKNRIDSSEMVAKKGGFLVWGSTWIQLGSIGLWVMAELYCGVYIYLYIIYIHINI